jgi:hypothetical protein
LRGADDVSSPIPNQPPALMRLALDVGLARLPLGVEGIEILLKPLLV